MKGFAVDACVFFVLALVATVVTCFAYKVGSPWIGSLILEGYALFLWSDALRKMAQTDFPVARTQRRVRCR